MLRFVWKSVFQLLEIMRKDDDGSLNKYKYNKMPHITMNKNIFILLYAEHIRFLVKKLAGQLLKYMPITHLNSPVSNVLLLLWIRYLDKTQKARSKKIFINWWKFQIFYFPKIFSPKIKKCLPYQVLTDTDSICFIIICELGCSTLDGEPRNIIFEIITKTGIKDRFDRSHPFLENFSIRDKNCRKN